MEINNLLCVGRGSLSNIGYTHSNRKLSDSICYSPSSRYSASQGKQNKEMTEKELIAKVSSSSAHNVFSSQTKSILRAKTPSPKQGSPSSLRNVRFSDKDSDDEVMFAKIHVNKTIQTENLHESKEDKKLNLNDLDTFTENFKMKRAISERDGADHVMTSTPRYDKGNPTPAPEFLTPLDKDTRGHLSPTNFSPERHSRDVSPKTYTIPFEHKGGRLVVDINIDRKKPPSNYRHALQLVDTTQTIPRETLKPKMKSEFGRSGPDTDLHSSFRSISPERTEPQLSDGHRIIQNMDLSDLRMKYKSTGSQTTDSTISSQRSASPERPYLDERVPDGNKIIQNMEFHSLDSSSKRKSESTQTNDIPDGRRIIRNMEVGLLDSNVKLKTESVQTEEIPDGNKIVQNLDREMFGKHPKSNSVYVQASMNVDFRDVPTQVDFDSSPEASPDSSIEEQGTRSIAIQASEPNHQEIPDGARILRNLEISRQRNTQELNKPKNHIPGNHQNNRGLNDGNWNEFVKHLELFNPSSSSSSSSSVSGEEPPPSPDAGPVLVYDKTASTSTVSKHNEGRPAAANNILSERNAQSYLGSETFTRDKINAVLNEGGLLQKLNKDFKSTQKPVVSAKIPVEKFSVRTSPVLFKSSVPNADFTTAMKPAKPNDAILKAGINDGMKNVQANGKHILTKETLAFTPIETYSFNPETLMKNAASRPNATPTVASTASSVNALSCKWSPVPSVPVEKENISKNAFIQGLDLGPAPKPAVVHRYSTPSNDLKTYSAAKPALSSNSNYGGLSNFVSYQYHKPTPTNTGDPRKPSYTRPLASYKTEDTLQQRPMHRSIDRLERPSSAPSNYNKSNQAGSFLTPSLKDIRTSAVRKSAMGSLIHKRKPLVWSGGAASRYSSSGQAYIKSPSQSTEYFRKHQSFDSIPNTKDVCSMKYKYNDPTLSKNCDDKHGFTGKSFLPRQVSSDKPTYLEALNDESNHRPPSRERSRSRSRSPKPSLNITARDLQSVSSSKPSNDTTRDVTMRSHSYFRAEPEGDRGHIDSIVTKGSREIPVKTSGYVTTSHCQSVTEGREEQTERMARSVSRKPPLPRNGKRSRSRSNSSDRFYSRDSNANSTSSEKGYKIKDKETEQRGVVKRIPIIKEKLMQQEQGHFAAESVSEDIKVRQDRADQRADNAGAAEVYCDNTYNTVTIGHVPTGVVNKDSMYLGHDTIQKIIEEARL